MMDYLKNIVQIFNQTEAETLDKWTRGPLFRSIYRLLSMMSIGPLMSLPCLNLKNSYLFTYRIKESTYKLEGNTKILIGADVWILRYIKKIKLE